MTWNPAGLPMRRAEASLPRRALIAITVLAAAAAAAACLSGTAVAADEIGLFFDGQAQNPCVQAGAFASLTTYLILLEPSASAGVSGWECSIDYDNATFTGYMLAGTALSVDTPPQFEVGLSPSLPRAPAVLLAQLNFVSGGSGPVSFYIQPYRYPSLPDTPVYATGADPVILLPMTPRTLGGGGAVAGVNLPECTPESATWGQVKATFQ